MEDSRYGKALFDKSGGKDLQLQALPDPSRALRGHRLQGIYLHICCCGSFIVLAIFVVFDFVYFDVILCVLFVLVLGLDDNPFGFYLFFFSFVCSYLTIGFVDLGQLFLILFSLMLYYVLFVTVLGLGHNQFGFFILFYYLLIGSYLTIWACGSPSVLNFL